MLDEFGEPRQQRGLEIAATRQDRTKGRRMAGAIAVRARAATRSSRTLTRRTAPARTIEDGGHKCKHLFAVEYVLRREEKPGRHGNDHGKRFGKLTCRIGAHTTPRRRTRKREFLELLRDLCSGVTEPERQRNGRPRLPIRDAIFAACFKVYSTVSARRFMTRPAGRASQGLHHARRRTSIRSSTIWKIPHSRRSCAR